jgi:RNA polymerase sigma factor (sigma-70 family)
VLDKSGSMLNEFFSLKMRVIDSIGQLKPEHQTILTLRFFENLDYDEIGRIVDARPATIRVTLHRILKRLREALRGDLGEDE